MARPWALAAAAALFGAGGILSAAVDPFDDRFKVDRGEVLLAAGKYQEAHDLAQEAYQVGWRSARWQQVRVSALLRTGRYEEAGDAAVSLVSRNIDNLPALVFVRKTLQKVGRAEEAAQVLTYINRLAAAMGEGAADFSAAELVALGEAALGLGADPKRTLTQFFETARRRDPSLADAHTAAAELALDKFDYALAADILTEGLAKAGESADLHEMLARAFAPSDGAAAETHLSRALDLNPAHFPSLRFVAAQKIDAEEYSVAEEILDKIFAHDPHDAEALALAAAVAYLENDFDAHRQIREHASQFRKDTPEIDHLIGEKISRHRRFAEGRDFQLEALRIDPGFLPAKTALALDYLRLGDEPAAWELVEAVHEADGYHVLAFNLLQLRDHLEHFETVERDGFILKMPPLEAGIYGARALDLLAEARTVLGEKYGLQMGGQILVEFFPQQQDFAVRTFGVPGGAGILGACFGSVVTMNSPGGRAAGNSNWEATLWHEYCHVVTLTVTKNRMPRWLSEGISVYEEGERDPRWGMAMTPAYSRRILSDGGLRNIGSLSAGFLNPEDGQDLMFAYFESSLAVRYFIETFGPEPLRAVLADLAEGVSNDDALARNFAPLPELEDGFGEFARSLAEDFGGHVDWEARSAKLARCAELLDAEDPDALPLAQELVDELPGYTGEGSAYPLLARAHRLVGDSEAERAVLQLVADSSADASFAFRRLTELAVASEDWDTAAARARQQLAVNPMTGDPHRALGRSLQATGQPGEAIASYENLLALGPVDPAQIRYRLAQCCEADGDLPKARQNLLLSLEQAPRFKDGYTLLQRLRDRTTDQNHAPD